MSRILSFLLFTASLPLFGQSAEENILYVIDSVAIINDPDEDDGELMDHEIETVNVVTSKSEIAKHGYKDLDKIFFIITKEYASRSDDLKRIPSLKQMEKRNGQWHLKTSSSPYSGPFAEYYINGKKRGEGLFKNGLPEGNRTVYFPDGKVQFTKNFINGLEHGEFKQFFPNGRLEQEGVFNEAKKDGIWKLWYSTGEIKKEITFKNGKAITSKEDDRFIKQMVTAGKLSNEGNYSAAIKAFNKAVELSPKYADVYFHRGTAYLYDLKFDEAIKDFDRAIDLEPFYKESISNRAFARLHKHEFTGSRTVMQTSDTMVLVGGNKAEIAKEELDKICADLKLAYSLGDKMPMILDAMKKHCQ